MILCAGLRGNTVDKDYLPYQGYFVYSPDRFTSSFFQEWASGLPHVDVGWIALNTLFKSLGLSFESLVLVMAVLSISLYGWFYLKYTHYPSLALLLYYSHAYFNREMLQMRSGLSCALALWAMAMIAKRKWLPAALVLAIAALLHLSAILVILPICAFLYKSRIRVATLLILSGVALVGAFIINEHFALFSLIDRVATYQDSDFSQSLGIINNPVTLKQIAVSCLFLLVHREHGASEGAPVYSILYWSYLISTVWLITFNEFGILAGRGATILAVGEPILLVECVAYLVRSEYSRKQIWLAHFMLVGLAGFMFFANTYLKQTVGIYKTRF